MIWYCMRHCCVVNINVCSVDKVSVVTETFHQSVQYRFLSLSLIHGTVWCFLTHSWTQTFLLTQGRGYWTAVIPTEGTELQLYQQRVLNCSYINRGYWTAVIPTEGTELQLYQQRVLNCSYTNRRYWTAVIPTALNGTNCLVLNPCLGNSLPDCAMLWCVITLRTRYELSSQLNCLQTHVLFVHHLQETWSSPKYPVDGSNLCFLPQCDCHVLPWMCAVHSSCQSALSTETWNMS